ncbi:hypothetical protein Efla_007306 [Eimeria flavescens]
MRASSGQVSPSLLLLGVLRLCGDVLCLEGAAGADAGAANVQLGDLPERPQQRARVYRRSPVALLMTLAAMLLITYLVLRCFASVFEGKSVLLAVRRLADGGKSDDEDCEKKDSNPPFALC